MMKKIKYSSRAIILVMICLTVSAGNFLQAQNDPESEAKKLFNAGHFEEALPSFRELTRLYPNDETLNYYLGACLAETNQLTNEARQALEIAKKKVPEAYFYLGKYYHARSDWKNAIRNYEQFKSEARKKSVQASSVEELLSMCRKQKNPFPAVADKNEEATPQPEEASRQIKAETPPATVPEVTGIPDELKDSLIHFQVNAVVSYNKIGQFRFDSSKEAFIKGWLIEEEMKKEMAELNGLRKEYETRVGPEKDSLAARILKLEQETYQMSQQTRNAWQQANLKEAGYWDKAGALEVDEFRREVSRIQDSARAVAEAQRKAQEQKLIILPDTAVTAADTIQSPPAAPASNVVYKIQIGAYRNAPPQWVQAQFKKLAIIRRIDQHVDEKGVTVYTVGELKSYDDAVQMQKQIRLEGMKNAFVAAYIGNRRISMEEAKKLTGQ